MLENSVYIHKNLDKVLKEVIQMSSKCLQRVLRAVIPIVLGIAWYLLSLIASIVYLSNKCNTSYWLMPKPPPWIVCVLGTAAK